MKSFLNRDSIEERLREIFTDALGDSVERWEEEIKEHASLCADKICSDMRKYLHKSDTSIAGNFKDIRLNWKWDGMEDSHGALDDVVAKVDDDTISDKELCEVQGYFADWFGAHLERMD